MWSEVFITLLLTPLRRATNSSRERTELPALLYIGAFTVRVRSGRVRFIFLSVLGIVIDGSLAARAGAVSLRRFFIASSNRCWFSAAAGKRQERPNLTAGT